MNQKELRLGNIVNINGIESRVALLAIGTMYGYEPIKLTKERLIKLGLTLDSGYFRIEYGLWFDKDLKGWLNESNYFPDFPEYAKR